jgi:hypothetical protein
MEDAQPGRAIPLAGAATVPAQADRAPEAPEPVDEPPSTQALTATDPLQGTDPGDVEPAPDATPDRS